MKFYCRFTECNYSCPTKFGRYNHERFCVYNPSSTVNGNVISTEEELGAEENGDMVLRCIDNGKNKSLTNMTQHGNEFGCDISEMPSHEADEEVDVRRISVESNQVNQIGEHLTGSDEEGDDDRRIETIAVNLCLIEKKVGKKTVNELIRSISDSKFNKEKFAERIRSVADCKKTCRDLVKRSFEEEGFVETVVSDNEGKFKGILYTRDIIKLVREQLKEANNENFYMHPVTKTDLEGRETFTHLLETKYARRIRDNVIERVLSSDNDEDIWMYGKDGMEESFVGMFQVHSDKSAVTLKKAGISAYPVHIVFLNFTYEKWKDIIMSEKTIVAYLPVDYETAGDDWKCYGKEDWSDNIRREAKSEILHESYRRILQPLDQLHNHGLLAELSNGRNVRCHPLIVSIATDTPEGKDITCILHGAKTNYPCPRCMCPARALNDGNMYEKRTSQKTLNLRRKANQISNIHSGNSEDKQKEADKHCRRQMAMCLRENSISTTISYFETTNLFLQNLDNNVYSSNTFEAMHYLDSGISKEIKMCIYRRLGTDHLKVSGPYGNNRSFKSCRNAILCSANEILKEIQSQSHVPGLHVDHSSKGSSATLNGLFSSEGISGMLEAKDMRSIDYVFPFVAAFIDRICGEEHGPVTSITVLYIEIIQMIFEKDDDKKWTDDDMADLQKYVKILQSMLISVFSEFQPSQFKTMKFHYLSHLVDDLKNFGDLRMCEVRFYENRQLAYKDEWARTSRKRSSSHVETMKRMNERAILSSVLKSQPIPSSQKRNEQNGLSKRGRNVNLCEIRELLEFLRGKVLDVEGTFDKALLEEVSKMFSDPSITLLKQLGDQGCEAFLNVMRTEVHKSDVEYYEHIQKICIVRSGVVKGGFVCDKDSVDLKQLTIKKLIRKKEIRQRYVSCENYRNTNRSKYSFVIFELNDRNSGKGCYIVGQIRALFIHAINGCRKEFAVIRYMEPIKPKDEIESTLGCSIFRWSTDDEIDYTTKPELFDYRNPPSPWFDIIQVSQIISVVQLIRLRYNIVETDDGTHWCRQRYALNRFIEIEMN